MRRVIVVAGVLLIAAVVGFVLLHGRDDRAASPVTVRWGGSENHPSCAYDAAHHQARARLLVNGTSSKPTTLRVTVTAYADENTSIPVGSTTRAVNVDGRVSRALVVTIPVEKPAHRGEDGETACKLTVR